jgi:pimeloyl-ACP methyl ester carboxylesterase
MVVGCGPTAGALGPPQKSTVLFRKFDTVAYNQPGIVGAQLSVNPLDGLVDCGVNRVLVGRGASSVLTWRDPYTAPTEEWESHDEGSQKIYLIQPFLPDRDKSRVKLISSGFQLQPLGWSPDSNHFNFLTYNKVLHRVGRGGEPVSFRVLGEPLRNVRLSVAQNADADRLLGRAGSQVRRFRKSRPGDRLSVVLYKDKVTLIAAPLEAGGVTSILSADGAATGPPTVMLRDPADAIFASGSAQAADMLMRSGAPYRKTVTDLATGRVVGFHDHRAVSVVPAAVRRSVASASALLTRPAVIRSVSVNGDSAAILFGDVNGENAVAVANGADSRLVMLCDVEKRIVRLKEREYPAEFIARMEAMLPANGSDEGASDDPHDRRIVDVPWAALAARHRSHALATLVTAPRNGKRDLVIFFPGGPGYSMMDGDPLLPARLLNRPDTDFMNVEFSGSIAGSPELALAFYKDGPAAVERDVAMLSDWVASQPYERVHLVGGSFGGVALLAARKNGFSKLCSLSLITPALLYRQPQEVIPPIRKWDREQMLRRAAFDRITIGGQAEIARFSAWFRNTTPLLAGTDAKAYFGKNDPIVKVGDLPPGFPGENVRIVAGSHADAGYSPEVWNSIRRDVGDACMAGWSPASPKATAAE